MHLHFIGPLKSHVHFSFAKLIGARLYFGGNYGVYSKPNYEAYVAITQYTCTWCILEGCHPCPVTAT